MGSGAERQVARLKFVGSSVYFISSVLEKGSSKETKNVVREQKEGEGKVSRVSISRFSQQSEGVAKPFRIKVYK